MMPKPQGICGCGRNYWVGEGSPKAAPPVTATRSRPRPRPMRLALRLRRYPLIACWKTPASMPCIWPMRARFLSLSARSAACAKLPSVPLVKATGEARDLDRFDPHYRHLFLWNKEKREIAGAYRMGEVQKIVARFGPKGLYTESLFRFPVGLSRLPWGLRSNWAGLSFVPNIRSSLRHCYYSGKASAPLFRAIRSTPC